MTDYAVRRWELPFHTPSIDVQQFTAPRLLQGDCSCLGPLAEYGQLGHITYVDVALLGYRPLINDEGPA